MARPPIKPPDLGGLIDPGPPPRLADPTAFFAALVAMAEGKALAAQGRTYLHWDDLRHREPPDGLTREGWWLALKIQRLIARQELPLVDGSGHSFNVVMADGVLELLQRVDSTLSGRIEVGEQVTDPASRDRYVVSALMEEAIASSQLEGASTTRRVAKDMLRSGRLPRTEGERMIANNYRAMTWVQQHQRDPVSRERVLMLHRILMEGAIEPADAAGRLRRADEQVRVFDVTTGEVVHVPPPAEELDTRLDRLVNLANDAVPGRFIHPVVRAIAVHFALAYDHPFVDGNGRTARALFQWVLLRNNYWLSEFLSPSVVANRAPAAYARAFQLTETDENDLTYFVQQQLDALDKAIQHLHKYLQRKQQELKAAERLLRDDSDLNSRQLALLSHALRHADATYTMESHGSSHRIAYATARGDLLGLVRRRFLEKRRVGKRDVFRVPADLARRLSRPS